MPKLVATEQDWIQLGLQAFSSGGVQALVVEKLAKQLGSSKTSFYWYFKNRETYLERIVDYWIQLTTASIIGHIEQNSEARPEQQVRSLLTFMFRSVDGKDFLHYLRLLGTEESSYECRLREIERQRLDYMGTLLLRCGRSEEEGERLSSLVYHYYLGWYERNKYKPLTLSETEAQVHFLSSILHIS